VNAIKNVWQEETEDAPHYRKVCGKWNKNVLNDDPRAMSVLLVTTYLP